MSSLCPGEVRFSKRRQANGFDTQSGASLVEFSIVGLSVILLGLFTLQIGLIYHAKTTLNYAAFEAARSGAVNNASMSAIRDELGLRLAPLQGGDGSKGRALFAVTQSALTMKDPVNTKVVILNPTKAAFKDWSVQDPVSGERFIPANHLRHQTYDVGKNSGLSLRDANLLKLQVTHGVQLRVPVVGKLMTRPMIWLDSENAEFYVQGKWPIQSVATVRMQSDSFESEILKSARRSESPNDESELDASEQGPAGEPNVRSEDVVAHDGNGHGLDDTDENGEQGAVFDVDLPATPEAQASCDHGPHQLVTADVLDLATTSELINTSLYRQMITTAYLNSE